MPNKKDSKLRWRLGVLAAFALVLLSLYPQFDLWRTTASRAPYVSLWFDEACYSAYVNALAEGRPRRNDPYFGLHDSPTTPLPENFFSVQFIPPYLLALTARLFGLSTSTVFTLLAPLSAFASALMLFWLLGSITKDDRVAGAGTIFVLCMGTLAGTPAELLAMLHLHQPFGLVPPLPFLRRYYPAVPFPFFLVFCTLVWRSLVCESGRTAVRNAVLAGLVFAVLVFSYFYLWTAALAWLACITALWLIARSDVRRRALIVFGVIAAFALAAFVPYVLLLSRRAHSIDVVTEFASTRAPDLFRFTELLGALVFVTLVVATWKGVVKWREGTWLFAASCALTPLICFNQQIVTGLSLMPEHYDLMIGNYLVLAAFVVTTMLFWRGFKSADAKMPRALLITIALASFCWAGAETAVQTHIAYRDSVLRMQEQPLMSHLREIARGIPQDQLASQVVLFTPSLLWVQADSLPTYAPQPVLLAPHLFIFGREWPECKERLYQYFYYTGYDGKKIDALAHADDNLRLVFHTYNPNPPPADTFPQWVIADYQAYVSSFNRERAAHPQLAYLVAAADDDADLTNLDRWYERDAGERVGDLVLYRLKLRP